MGHFGRSTLPIGIVSRRFHAPSTWKFRLSAGPTCLSTAAGPSADAKAPGRQPAAAWSGSSGVAADGVTSTTW